jgi:hypothetical protein
MVHHFLDVHSLGARNIHLNADNCCGQNKNNALIIQVMLTTYKFANLTLSFYYFMRRILTGRSKSITYSYLPVGHTKFSPDWCFGLLKKKYCRTEVNCLDDIAQVVERSSTVNVAQLVGTSNGEVLVPMYDWTGYFAPIFRIFPNIKKFNHYSFTANNRQDMTVRKLSDSPPSNFAILKANAAIPPSQVLPDIIHPRGLPPQQQWYLYDKIRKYCSPETQSITCPIPSVPRPGTSCVTPTNLSPDACPSPSVQSRQSTLTPTSLRGTITQSSSTSLPVASISLPQASSITSTSRTSSKCGQTGHNRRTCKT